MNDAVVKASADGFLLGLLVAEQAHELPPGSTMQKQETLFDIVLGVADGTNTLIPDDAAFCQTLSPTADVTQARAAMQAAALNLVEWYRREFLS